MKFLILNISGNGMEKFEVKNRKKNIRSKKILDIRTKLIISSIGQSNTDTLLDSDQGWHAFRR